MDSIILLIGCVFIASAIGLVFLMVLGMRTWQRQQRNRRAHVLGKRLVWSHPEWN